jgi:hypothetical protein
MSAAASVLDADRDEVARFVTALFRYADGGTHASLRAFDQFRRDVPAELIVPVAINGDLTALVDAAIRAANRCAHANHRVVFAPPICTFTNPNHARAIDLANGLVLSVEVDEGDTDAARARLEGLLGAATVIVASGGTWIDPETGEVHPKLHLHWRLSEPTRSEAEHQQLRQARNLAAQLAGADPTGKPIVHPLRWPGSWNTKDPGRPRMARIVACEEEAQIHLAEALEALSNAAELAGWASADLPRSSEPQALLWMLQSAMSFNANPDLHYGDWVARGYACWHATGGTPDGFALFDAFSQKSAKYDAGTTEAVWQAIGKACRGGSPPIAAGAGSIFFYARLGGWKRPPITDDPGYTASLGTEAEERANHDAQTASPGTPPPDDPPQPDDDHQPPDDEQPPPHSEDDDFVLPVEFSENMLAYEFSQQHAHRLVYVHGWGKWMRWDAGCWREDHAITVFDEARKICAKEGERACNTLPPRSAAKVAAAINKAACVAAIERLARHHEGQVRPVEAFDADLMLLNGPRQNHPLKRD